MLMANTFGTDPLGVCENGGIPFCKQPTDTLNNPFHDGHLDSSDLPKVNGLTAAFQLYGGERLPSHGRGVPPQQQQHHGGMGASSAQSARIPFDFGRVHAAGRVCRTSHTWGRSEPC